MVLRKDERRRQAGTAQPNLRAGGAFYRSVPDRAQRTVSDVAEGWPPGVTISPEPVRRVHTRSRRRNTSLILSTLPLGMRVSESQVETRFLKVVQLEPRAEVVRSQPTWLRVVQNGRVRRRAPDFAVKIDGHAELHETKQDKECGEAVVQAELLAIEDEVRRHPGWRYSVTLESTLQREPLRSNTDMLWRELVPTSELDLDLRLRTLSILDDGAITGAELIERTSRGLGLSNAPGLWQSLLAMVAAGVVDFDVDQLLTPDSLFWNGNSGPPRKRTLPFLSVDDAIRSSQATAGPIPFCSVKLRSAPQ